MKIVIADDDPDVLETTAMVLEAVGHDVRCVDVAHDILDVLREEAPRVLLQDVHMPDLDIDRHLQAIRADPALAGVAVLVFTGRPPGDDELAAWRPDGILQKPFDLAALRRAVDAFDSS